MKKILFVVESLSGGGAEKVLLTLIKNLDKSKYNITVFSIVKTGVYAKKIEKNCNVIYGLKEYSDYYNFFGKLYCVVFNLFPKPNSFKYFKGTYCSHFIFIKSSTYFKSTISTF